MGIQFIFCVETNKQCKYYYRIKLGGYRGVYAIINGKIVVIKTVLAGRFLGP